MAKLSAKNKTALIVLAVAAVLITAGSFIPFNYCSDGCNMGPSVFLISPGIALAIVAGLAFGYEPTERHPSIWSRAGSKWFIGISIVVGMMSMLNGWAIVMMIWALMAAAPFILIGLAIYFIVRFISRKKASATKE